VHRAAVALALAFLASGCVGAAQVAAGPSLPHALLGAAPRELVIEVGAVAGRLLPGRLADVLVVRGDPAREIADLWNVLDVYQAGRRVERGVA